MKDYHNIEEEFHAKDRKAGKKERKRIREKDRSKYKKSDQNKEMSKVDAFEGRAGRVLSISTDTITVQVEERALSCSMKGTLKKERTHQKNPIAVGDRVIVDEEDQITFIEERTSILARADNLHRRKQQLIATNIDQVLITASIKEPTLKPSLIDRYIIASLKGNMRPVIIINKIDLLDKEDTLLSDLRAIYEKMSIPFFPISVKEKVGCDQIKSLLEGASSVISGQSGVGKTSLINAVTGLNLRTSSVVDKTKKGAHTTTQARLIPIGEDSYIIDTPGIKSFGLWDIDPNDILSYFQDLHELQERCKYPNCSHLHEPGCYVKEAVEKGEIPKVRYESYKTIREGHDKDHKDYWD